MSQLPCTAIATFNTVTAFASNTTIASVTAVPSFTTLYDVNHIYCVILLITAITSIASVTAVSSFTTIYDVNHIYCVILLIAANTTVTAIATFNTVTSVTTITSNTAFVTVVGAFSHFSIHILLQIQNQILTKVNRFIYSLQCKIKSDSKKLSQSYKLSYLCPKASSMLNKCNEISEM